MEQESFDKLEYDKLENLAKSNCINLSNGTFRNHAEKYLSEEQLNEIIV